MCQKYDRYLLNTYSAVFTTLSTINQVKFVPARSIIGGNVLFAHIIYFSIELRYKGWPFQIELRQIISASHEWMTYSNIEEFRTV